MSDTVTGSSTSSSRSMPSPPRVRAGATAPPAERVATDAHRERALERLDRRVARVRHGGVHAAHAVGPRTRALPAADRLVVHPAVAADQHVVHRALARGPELVRDDLGERAEAHVGDALAHLDVAGADRDRRNRGHDRARWRDHGDRPHGATVRRDRRIGRGAHRERHRAHRHRLDRVDVPRALRVGAGEVERRVVAVDRQQRARYVSATAGRGAGRRSRARRRNATRRRAAPRARRASGVRRSRRSRRAARPNAARSTTAACARPEPVRAALRVEVAAPLVGRARARDQDLGHRVVETDRRDAKPFLGDLGRVRRHRARRHAAEIGVVRAVRHPTDERAPDEARRHERDVVQVGAAGERDR